MGESHIRQGNETHRVEFKRWANGLNGRFLFRHQYLCEECRSSIGVSDNFCRVCGREIIGLNRLEEVGP